MTKDKSTNLSKSQKDFLDGQGVPMSKVFNAKGMASSKYKPLMRAGDFLVAYGVTPCNKGGHTLRARSGHCVQCDTKHLAYVRRQSEPGYVYIAYSRSTTLIKIGASTEPSGRKDNLNGYAYGGARDWVIVESFFTQDYARFENLAQKHLRAYQASGKYYDRGGWIDCDELYSCSVEAAKKAIIAVLK